MNDDKITKALLQKFFDKSCTDQERAKVERWLIDPGNKALAEKMMLERWEDEEQIKSESLWNQRSTLRRIHDRMKKGEVRKPEPVYQDWQKGAYTRILKIAAAILIPLIAAGAFWLFNQPQEQADIALIQKINQGGQKSTLLLPDGSKVWLNAASSLKYPPQFINGKREIQLVGEAFFDVVKDPEKPFIVKTSDIDVKVFGTSFNVSAYPDDGFTETTVVTGLVGVRQNWPTIEQEGFTFINPNQMAHFSPNTREFTTKTTDISSLISWKEGRLKFDRTPFPVVIKKLQRWYGASIVYEDQNLQSELLTFTVTNESLEKILELMGSLIPIEYQFQNSRQVLINDK